MTDTPKNASCDRCDRLAATVAVLREALEALCEGMDPRFAEVPQMKKARQALSTVDDRARAMVALLHAARETRRIAKDSPGWPGAMFLNGTDEGTLVRDALAALDEQEQSDGDTP